jgi:hypothetical protein
MALMPYTKRVSQTRAGRPPRDGDDRPRRPRDEEAATPPVEAQVEAVETDATDEVEA